HGVVLIIVPHVTGVVLSARGQARRPRFRYSEETLIFRPDIAKRFEDNRVIFGTALAYFTFVHYLPVRYRDMIQIAKLTDRENSNQPASGTGPLDEMTNHKDTRISK